MGSAAGWIVPGKYVEKVGGEGIKKAPWTPASLSLKGS